MAYTTQPLYTKEVIGLTHSVLVKLEAEIEVQNNFLTEIGYKVDRTDPSSWIYYCHLAGEYHPADEKMRVISLDTLEVIDFTYNNLRLHRATYNAYRNKTEYYYELANKYMHQLDLIDGILNPIDKKKAIAAPEFSILRYDNRFVNSNETNLIPELQKFVNQYCTCWYNHNYFYYNKKYAASFLAGLYTHVSGAIINIRKRNVKTEYVHDYHLWAYLASHQRLDKYSEMLTREQALWLYRNIEYLESHPGWQSTFEELVEWLLTKRSIPLTSFELVHNLEKLEDNIAPESEVLKRPLNKPAQTSGSLEKETIESVLNKEIPVARDNIDYYPEQIRSIPERMKLSPFSRLETKVLESNMIDRSDAMPIHLIQTVMNEWVYLVTEDYYKAVINITNPYTSEVISMTAKEAIAVWIYCLHRQFDYDLTTVPTFLALNVMRPIPPTFGELRGIAPLRYIDEEMILAVLEEHVAPGNIISIEKFYETASSIHNGLSRLRYLYSTQEHQKIRGYMKLLANRMFMDHRCVILKDTAYLDLFHQKGWKLDKMTREQYSEFADSIFVKATGIDLKSINNLRSVQEAMLAILKQLSSYSIQLLSHITDSAVNVIDRPVVKYGDVDTESSAFARVKLGVDLTHYDAQSHIGIKVPVGRGVDLSDAVKLSTKINVQLDPTAKFTSNTRVVTSARLKLPLARYRIKRAVDISGTITEPALSGVWKVDISAAFDRIEGAITQQALDTDWPDPFEEAGLEIETPKLNGIDAVPFFRTFQEIFSDDVLGGFNLTNNE